MKGLVDLGVGYIPRWFTCTQTITHPGTNWAWSRKLYWL